MASEIGIMPYAVGNAAALGRVREDLFAIQDCLEEQEDLWGLRVAFLRFGKICTATNKCAWLRISPAGDPQAIALERLTRSQLITLLQLQGLLGSIQDLLYLVPERAYENPFEHMGHHVWATMTRDAVYLTHGDIRQFHRDDTLFRDPLAALEKTDATELVASMPDIYRQIVTVVHGHDKPSRHEAMRLSRSLGPEIDVYLRQGFIQKPPHTPKLVLRPDWTTALLRS